MEDPALLIVRIALIVAGTSAGWIVVSLVVDVVRLLRGKVTTRTFMGAVARYLVVGAAVTPTVTAGGTARAATCDTTTTDESTSSLWITPVVSGVTALGVVMGREKLRRRDDNVMANTRETCDDGLGADHLVLESEVSVPNCVPPHEFMVGVLGPVNVTTADGDRVKFARSRSEELVVWLALHPSKRFRSMARADMWAEPVKDSTFANITSDARKAVQSCDGVSSLGVTLNDELSLTGVVSDLEILRRCVDHARRWPDDGGSDALRYGLSLVRGTPFSGVSYIWSDSTGLATEAVMLVVRAATMLADMCSDADDPDGVYWATGQGLLAVPGQEDLLAVRLRLHAERQDRAGLVAEWNAYLRMLAGDPWSDGHPSSTMAEVWRELTA
jgi:hypothetical protein